MFKKLSLAALALATVSATTDDQAFFAILVETKVGRMAGMPVIDMRDIPPGFNLPREAMKFSGQPTRFLDIRLWSPTIAPPDAKAWVVPPAGLKQGNQLNLELFRPNGKATGGKVKDYDPDSNPESFTIKIYWGSSETVKEGQPKVITWSGIGEDQKEAMRNRMREANLSDSSYYYKEGWTTGYWPTKAQPGKIDKAASLVGKYALNTTYTGNVEIEAPSNVEFMAPIVMTSPNLDKKIDLKRSMVFNWQAIPSALGLHASIIGMEGKNTMIIWTSSEVFSEELMGDMGFLQMAEVRDYVSKTIFMDGTRTTVSVPAGIFAESDFAMMNMAGYGPGAALEKAQPLPRIQTKTSLMLMLGGKKVRM